MRIPSSHRPGSGRTRAVRWSRIPSAVRSRKPGVSVISPDPIKPGGREARPGAGRRRRARGQAELEVLAVVERVIQRGHAIARDSSPWHRRGSGSPRRRGSRPARHSRRGCGPGRRRGRRTGRSWRGSARDSCKARASAIRGSGRRCRPANRLPPSGPVTRIASPGLAPERRTAPRAVAWPSTVTVTTSGPSQALVSPPTRSTPNRSASADIPRMQPLGHLDGGFLRQVRRRRPRRAEFPPSPRCPRGSHPSPCSRPPRRRPARAGNGGRPSACRS